MEFGTSSGTRMSCSSVQMANRLPSLDNLLESEVILGDDGDDSSCGGDDSEMHSAREDLSESTSTNATDLKFADCSRVSSSAATEAEVDADCEIDCVPDEEAHYSAADLNLSLPLTQSCYQESPADFASLNGLSLTKSYYAKNEKSSPSRSLLCRSNSTMTSQNLRSPSRLISPRQPSYADNTTSSKNRFVTASSSAYPFSPTKRYMSSSNSFQQQQQQQQQSPGTPATVRKQSVYSPGTPRPTVPPKPATLCRQTSNMKSLTTVESPVSSRRSISASAPPASKQFAANGRQPSVIRSSCSKPATPTKPSTPSKTLTPPRRDERYATMGRRPSRQHSASPGTIAGIGIGIGINSFATASMEANFIARDTKAAADKFATLPRRKVKDRPPIPKFGCREAEASIPAKAETSSMVPRIKKLASPTSSPVGLGKPLLSINSRWFTIFLIIYFCRFQIQSRLTLQ